MLVTDRHLVRGGDLRPAVTQAVLGGVGLVHVRERDLDDRALARLLDALRAALPEATPIVINNRPELARALGVGLHLPAAAPTALATTADRSRTLGRSAHDEDEVRRACREQVDYVLLGTIYPTRSKLGHPGAGIELVRTVARHAAGIPVLAIGGVTVARIPELVHAGAHGVAACRAFLEAPDPARVAQAMTLALTVAGS